MSNGAYGLVPAALRETGRTMRDIIGTEAEGRVSKAQQGLEMTKLKYGLGKDIRAERQRAEQLEFDRGMDAPTTAAGALDFFVSTGQVTPEQKETMLNSEMFQLLKDETAMGGGRPVTPRSIITVMDTLRKERKAEAVAETERAQEIEDLKFKRETQRQTAQVKADAALEKQLKKEERAAGKMSFVDKEYTKDDIERIQDIDEQLRTGTMPDPGGGFQEVPMSDEYQKALTFEQNIRRAQIDARQGGYEIEIEIDPTTGAKKIVRAGTKPEPKSKPKPQPKPEKTLTSAEQEKMGGIKAGLAEGRLEGIKEGWREKSREQRQGKKRKENLKKRIASLQKTIERYPSSGRTDRRQKSLARLQEELADLET